MPGTVLSTLYEQFQSSQQPYRETGTPVTPILVDVLPRRVQSPSLYRRGNQGIERLSSYAYSHFSFVSMKKKI